MNNEFKKLINETIQRKIGITYDEFELLNFEEQQKLISKIKVKENKDILVMIGSGEYSILAKKKYGTKYMLDDGTIIKVGITPEESRKELENRLDDVIYTKPIVFVKKLIKKIK